jgi:hypothetical protein
MNPDVIVALADPEGSGLYNKVTICGDTVVSQAG